MAGRPLGAASGGDPGFWERLGMDDGGLPTHLPMGVTRDGQGPANDSEAHHYVCWCGDVECPLSLALQHPWAAGRRQGHRDAMDAITWMDNDPDWKGQGPSMGFAATLDQELTERPGYARRQMEKE